MPWTITHIASQDPGKTTPRIADERDQPVAYVLQADKAALLAAAPELLEALSGALDLIDALLQTESDEVEAVRKARAAINKATQ